MKLLASLSLLSAIGIRALAQSADVASPINQFGLDLLRLRAATASPDNQLFSPYSLESALAMAWVGADGQTREEMRRVLHLTGDEGAVVDGFSMLARDLRELQDTSRRRAEDDSRRGVEWTPTELDIANRLFVQSGFALQPAFSRLLRDQFGSPHKELDFHSAAGPARVTINTWVERETHGQIRDLIPSGALGEGTRLVLANAVYLKASWMNPFEAAETRLEAFWVGGATQVEVPTMEQRRNYPYKKYDGFTALALPCEGGLQFLILLPDQRDGLAELERRVTPAMLVEGTELPRRDVFLCLPKFKLAPPSVSLGASLQKLGMATAFDQPRGSADFSRMTPRRSDFYLCLSDVFHRAWLSVDENGAEAAAGTAVLTVVTLGVEADKPMPPVEVRVDRPFLFAIQHVSSGACLFLGRLGDPRQ